MKDLVNDLSDFKLTIKYSSKILKEFIDAAFIQTQMAKSVKIVPWIETQ